MFSNESLEPFFNPKGIVIVGARTTPGFGMWLPPELKNKGFGDRLRLVNPKGGEMYGMPVYKKATEVPDPVELALVVVPSRAVPGVIVDIGERGIRYVIIMSAGFAEAGPDGEALQAEILAAKNQYGLRIIGPNCIGLVNNENGFTTAETLEEATKPGNLGIIAQSGVFGNVLLDGLYQKGLYVSKAVTLGNRIDVNESEVLNYLHKDPMTDLIMMYLEGASDGRLLTQTLNSVTRDKPVLVLKSGRTDEGKAATKSHTGSMSGEDHLYESMFAQTGATRVENLEELIQFARAFATQPLPHGNRLGIVTSSGSMGALATDAAIRSGLKVAPLSETTIQKVRDGAPEWMNVKNPLDVGPSGQFLKGFTALMEDPDIDMVISIIASPFMFLKEYMKTGSSVHRWFGDLPAIHKQAGKPLLICAVSNSEFVDYFTKDAGPKVPVLTSPEMAAKAMAALWRYQNSRKKKAIATWNK